MTTSALKHIVGPMYTAEDLANLEAAIKKGVTRVRIGDQEVQYQSLSDMRKLASRMRRDIAKTPRVYRARPSRG